MSNCYNGYMVNNNNISAMLRTRFKISFSMYFLSPTHLVRRSNKANVYLLNVEEFCVILQEYRYFCLFVIVYYIRYPVSFARYLAGWISGQKNCLNIKTVLTNIFISIYNRDIGTLQFCIISWTGYIILVYSLRNSVSRFVEY